MEERSDPASAPMSPNVVTASAPPLPAKKDRHIVTWTPEVMFGVHPRRTTCFANRLLFMELKIGRILHASSRKRLVASAGEGKHLFGQSERNGSKKGWWSPEEDMLLCEAQKIFGNRWTEIAKVVSGRTDNAVKNRFSTLCKKRAKLEATSSDLFVNSTNKRLAVQIGCSNALAGESELMDKQIRYRDSNNKENIERLLGKDEEGDSSRQPLAVLVQNFNIARTSITKTTKSSSGVSENHNQVKVNAENTDQSLDDAWKELQDFLVQTEQYESEKEVSGINILVDDIKDLIEGLKKNKAEVQQPLRTCHSHNNSLGSSKHSTRLSDDMKAEIDNFVVESENSLPTRDRKKCVLSDDASSLGVDVYTEATLMPSGTPEVDKENLCTTSLAEFSTLQTILPFKSFADGIPSPAFTASERQFLHDVLDLSSPSPSPHLSKEPSCKRVLLDSL